MHKAEQFLSGVATLALMNGLGVNQGPDSFFQHEIQKAGHSSLATGDLQQHLAAFNLIFQCLFYGQDPSTDAVHSVQNFLFVMNSHLLRPFECIGCIVE